MPPLTGYSEVPDLRRHRVSRPKLLDGRSGGRAAIACTTDRTGAPSPAKGLRRVSAGSVGDIVQAVVVVMVLLKLLLFGL